MDLPSWIDAEAWDAWVDMRKTVLKKPLTDRAKKMAIKLLEELLKQGDDPTAVLDQSTFNNWQGLFALKKEVQNVERTTRGTRNFAEEAAEQRRERNDRILSRMRTFSGDIHREEAGRRNSNGLGRPTYQIPKVEADEA